MKALMCENCGAPMEIDSIKCEYCDTYYTYKTETNLEYDDTIDIILNDLLPALFMMGFIINFHNWFYHKMTGDE